MRRKATIRVVIAVAIVGIALPVLAALYLAHRQSMDSEIELANSMTNEILRRSDQAGTQATNALHRIESAPQPLSCSDSGLSLMRNIDMESSYLQTVAMVADGRMMCSSFGRLGEGIALGPVDYVSILGTQVRTSVALGSASEKRFLVLQKGTAAAVIDPEELIDTFVDRKEVALGVYGASGGKRLSSRGFFDSRWITRFKGAASTVFFDGSYLVSMKRSARFDTVAYVAVPVANLRARLMVFARVIVPIALVLAAGLSFGIVKLARQRASLPAELRAALKRREFELHYQPIVNLRTRHVVGVEALLRWPNRDGPLLRPDLFIPVAEECGLIQQFTNYVLEQVAIDAPRLLAVYPDAYVSINLSSEDLHSEAIVASLSKLLQTRGIRPENILVEATEHSFLDPDRARQVVGRIRELGIRVAIDDFGTGYSSLSQLTKLPTDYLKIDKVFVDTVGTDSATSQVALHIIRIAESLGLKIIGEGVETEVQARFLGEHGVQFAQGWLFHVAMPIEQLLGVIGGHATNARPAS
jgi:sensor c-di-GMP phosphodiesterase-like protein